MTCLEQRRCGMAETEVVFRNMIWSIFLLVPRTKDIASLIQKSTVKAPVEQIALGVLYLFPCIGFPELMRVS